MVKIFIDTGTGKIEEREKTDFSKKETIGDVVHTYNLHGHPNGVEILECKYRGNHIPLDFELKPEHSEIRVRLKRPMITFEFIDNETKKVVQRFAYEDAQVYRIAYLILADRKISTSGLDVHIFIADTEKGDEKLKKIPTFSTVSFGQTYKVFLTPAYYPTSIPDNDKKFAEALRKLFPEIEARQFGQTIRPSVPSRTTNTADEGLKQSSKELSDDSRKEKERTEALLKAPAKPIRHSMDKRLEVEKSSTGPTSPAEVDSKTPTSCSEVTEKRRKELPNTADQKLAEFMEKLTVKMSDDNSRQVEAVKSMIGQIFKPEETEEYKKLKRGCKKLLKELQTSQEVMKKHVDKYNEVKTKLEQERKLVAELQQDLKLSKSQCELNLRKMQGYKKRMDEEIERNVEVNLRFQNMTAALNCLIIQVYKIFKGKESEEKLEESSTCESFEVFNQNQFQISDDSPYG